MNGNVCVRVRGGPSWGFETAAHQRDNTWASGAYQMRHNIPREYDSKLVTIDRVDCELQSSNKAYRRKSVCRPKQTNGFTLEVPSVLTSDNQADL